MLSGVKKADLRVGFFVGGSSLATTAETPIVDNIAMASVISRVLGLLALWGSYHCLRWIADVWHWADQNGHTEGSPAGLGIFAMGIGIDVALFAVGSTLAVLGLFGLFFPSKKFFGRNKSDE